MVTAIICEHYEDGYGLLDKYFIVGIFETMDQAKIAVKSEYNAKRGKKTKNGYRFCYGSYLEHKIYLIESASVGLFSKPILIDISAYTE